MEREDVDFLVECFNDIDFRGEYTLIEVQISKSAEMKQFDNSARYSSNIANKSFKVVTKAWTFTLILLRRLGVERANKV